MRDGFQLGCGCCVDEFFEDREVEALTGPGDEFLKVDFAYGADGIELLFWLVWYKVGLNLRELMLTSAELASYLVR